MHCDVLDFWFDPTTKPHWFAASDDFDQTVKMRFGALTEKAAASELHAWRDTALGRLAEIILLDQFSRTIWRNTPRAFSQDAQALVLAQEAVRQNALKALDEDGRQFLLMPIMHSESRAIHAWGEPLFKQHTSENVYAYELKHKVIIDRFGRYPHRNHILGRVSSAEELAFLEEPNSSF